ncbi:hypothetical protein MLD38_008644 [Melastoma candidum]|uniref:Uncharacterized protein n=1 Tax=Melastoma candidum TaxID=119954 RepID=A0ACB9S3I6_9MYRT|nr:hypothetical protein MLD38_008644 [Melastoma candidum]
MPIPSSVLFFCVLLLFVYPSTYDAASRQLQSTQSTNHVILNPGTVFPSGESQDGNVIETCLPKGPRHQSAPSHYINVRPLGYSSMCSTESHGARP